VRETVAVLGAFMCAEAEIAGFTLSIGHRGASGIQTADDDAQMSRTGLQANEAQGRTYVLRTVAYSRCDTAGVGTCESQHAQG